VLLHVSYCLLCTRQSPQVGAANGALMLSVSYNPKKTKTRRLRSPIGTAFDRECTSKWNCY